MPDLDELSNGSEEHKVNINDSFSLQDEDSMLIMLNNV